MTEGMPKIILRLEGLALLVASVVAFAYLGHSWWLFAILLFAPDISMVGYFAGPRNGAPLYNAFHTTIVPLALGAAGLWLAHPLTVVLATIWLAHIGIDRLFGYGLKYPTDFKDTHLGSLRRNTTTGALN
jgi:Domain of unknown function (DUF4260)